MSLHSFLGLPKPAATTSSAEETETVRRVVAALESIPADRARYLAGFAYIMSRAADADMNITDEQTRLMETTMVEVGGLSEAEAVIVVEIAKSQTRLFGGTEDFLVTREWAKDASVDQRMQALRCAFAVEATDQLITSEESTVLDEIADELGLDRVQLNEVRDEYRDSLAAVKLVREAGQAG